jgi:hypothetical protein
LHVIVEAREEVAHGLPAIRRAVVDSLKIAHGSDSHGSSGVLFAQESALGRLLSAQAAEWSRAVTERSEGNPA